METLKVKLSSKLSEENDKEMEDLYLKFAQIFQANSCDAELYSYLKQIALPTNQVCAKKLMFTGSWSCRDCEMDSTCIICNECYENSKEKHKGHRVTFKHNTHGCCDCGDPDAWKPSGFCSKHQGTFSTEEAIAEFINQSFPVQTIESIQFVLIEMVKRVIAVINAKKVTSILTNTHLSNFITFITRICEANQAILHIVAEVFIGNYPFPTSHQCFKLTSSTIEIVNHGEQKENEPHQCSCCFIQILFQVFGSTNKHEQFLYLLLHNYKLKIRMGLSLFCSFDALIKNKCEAIQDFSVQIITEEISDIILRSSGLMTYIADKIYNLFKDSFDSNSNLWKGVWFIPRFYYDIIYLLKPKTIHLLKEHVYFYLRIIDILTLFHNSVVLTTASSFQKELFDESNIKIEIYLLELFSLIMTLFDYSNIENTNIVFDYFIDIFKQKKYKQLLPNEYSFHICIIRAFSIFITYYSFWYALNHKVDIHIALTHIVSQKDFDFKEVIREVFKLLGFVLSCKLRYWIYYGETSLYFSIAYTNCSILFQCDFSLIKLLCSLSQYAPLLSIDNIFQSANVNGFYEELAGLLIKSADQMDTIDLVWSKKNDSKHIQFGQQLLILFTNILRMNDYMIDLLYVSYEDIMKNKVISDIHQLFDVNERQSIDAYLKSRLVHAVIANENYCSYSLIIKELSPLVTIFKDEQEIMVMLNEMLDKTKGGTKKSVGFSLKPQYYNQIDLSLIFEGDKESRAERYITEFKKKEINALQSPSVAPSLKCNKILQMEYEAAFYSISNSQWMILFFMAQLSDSKWENIQRHYLFNTMKLLNVMIAINKSGNDKINESIKMLQDNKEGIIGVLDKPLVSIDDIQKEYCDYLKKEIIAFTNYTVPLPSASITIDENNDMNNNSSNISKSKSKSKKNEMLEKYRKKFKEKNIQFQESISNQTSNYTKNEENTIVENNNDSNNNISTITETIKTNESEHICVICRVSIDSNCYFKTPYGRFGVIVSDYFLRNVQIQTMKRVFEEDKELLSSQIFFDSFIILDPQFQKNKKQKRVLTCNHFVHFTCYEEFATQSIKYSNTPSFQCPFCKLYSNTCIPMLDSKTLCDKISEGMTMQKAFEAYNKKQLASLKFELDKTSSFDWQYPNHRFIEDILSANRQQSILITDLSKSIEMLVNVHLALVDHLRGFFVFYENYSYEQISLMHTIICSLQVLSRTNYIRPSFFFERFFCIVSEVCELNTYYLNYSNCYKSESLFTEALLVYMILFNTRTENDDDNNSMLTILQIFLPSIFANMFIAYQIKQNYFKLPSEKFINCITNEELGQYINSEQAKIYFNSYLNKLVLCKKIMNYTKPVNIDNSSRYDDNQMSLDEISKFNMNMDELNLSEYKSSPLMSLLKLPYPGYWPKVINPYDAINSILSSFYTKAKDSPITVIPSFYSLGIEYKYHFIPLPGDILELASLMSSTKCYYCSKLICYSVLCLTCGKKMCFNSKCIIEKSNDSSIGLYSSLDHSNKCGGGNSVYITLDKGEFIFISKRKIIRSHIFAYLNQFGEEPRSSDISNEYHLSQSNVNKVENLFISFSYRKTVSSLDIFGTEPDFDSDGDNDNDII